MKTKTEGLYINQKWVPAKNQRAVINPTTGETLAEVAEANEKETNQAIEAARVAFDSGPWKDYTAQRRGRVLFAMAEMVRKHAKELAELETKNMGKPLLESEYDMADVATCFEYYGGMATKIMGETNPVPDNALSLTLKEPVGVCGLIIPWNYPLMMLAWKVAPAIAAGCTMVLKPAEQTPLTALKFAGWLADEVPDLPAGVLNIITGDGETCGNAIVCSPLIDKVAFTGGTETGQLILKKIGETHLKKVSLELGGKSPHLFFADADMGAAIDGALFGSFVNQGEVCSATSRFLIDKKIYNEFMSRLEAQAKKVIVGDPLDSKVKMGPLVTHEHRDRVASFVERAEKQGAKVALRGEITNEKALGKGAFYKPTVLTEVSPEMEIFNKEVFGPVVTVTPFSDEAEAIKLANASSYGLAGAVWSRDIFRAMRVMKQLRCGIVWINHTQPAYIEAPWGGYKQSGLGRELGKYGVEEFLETKQVHINLNEAPIGWY